MPELRLVSISNGEPLPILPPSRELDEALRKLVGEARPQENCIPGADITGCVIRHCLGVSSPFSVALLECGSDHEPRLVGAHPSVRLANGREEVDSPGPSALSIGAHPLAYSTAVVHIVSTWPDRHPWHRWRVIVERCATEYATSFFPYLRLTNPEIDAVMREEERAEAQAIAEAHLARTNSPPVPTPPIEATPAPAASPPVDYDGLISELRKARKVVQAALIEYMRDKNEATVGDVASHVHDDPEPNLEAVKKNVARVNRFLTLKESPLRFRVASWSVFKEISTDWP